MKYVKMVIRLPLLFFSLIRAQPDKVEPSQLIVLKLGGSLITSKDTDQARINGRILSRIAREINGALVNKKIKLVIVHGTGPFGHVAAKKYVMPFLHDPEKLAEGLSVTKLSLQDLNYRVVKQLVRAKVNAVSFSPSAAGICTGGVVASLNLESLKKMLDLGLVPVLHGDCLMDTQKGFGIASSDALAAYLAKELKASRVIVAMDYNGVFTGDPRETSSKKINVMTKDQLGLIQNSQPLGTDITGGIKKKVEELLSLSSNGIAAEIIGGKERGYVKRALSGTQGLGTIIR